MSSFNHFIAPCTMDYGGDFPFILYENYKSCLNILLLVKFCNLIRTPHPKWVIGLLGWPLTSQKHEHEGDTYNMRCFLYVPNCTWGWFRQSIGWAKLWLETFCAFAQHDTFVSEHCPKWRSQSLMGKSRTTQAHNKSHQSGIRVCYTEIKRSVKELLTVTQGIFSGLTNL